MRLSFLLVVGSVAGPLLPGVARAQTYAFVVDSPSSSMVGDVSADAHLSGTLIGNYDQVTNPTGTRTLDWNIFGIRPPPPTNISKTFSGPVTSTGTPNTNPDGAFTLAVDTTALTVTLSGLASDLVGTSPDPVFPINITLTYQSFLTANPNYSYPFLLPIPVKLGDAVLTRLDLAQNEPASGPLTPAGGGSYTFSLSVSVTLTPELLFNGSPVSGAPAVQTVTINGAVTPAGATAAATLTTTVSQSSSSTTPEPLPPLPVPLPPPSGTGDPANIIMSATINNSSTDITADVSLVGAGSRVCCVDFNGDEELDFSDIEGFLAAYTAQVPGACAPGADMNGDEEFDFSDIEAFLAKFNAGC